MEKKASAEKAIREIRRKTPRRVRRSRLDQAFNDALDLVLGGSSTH